MNRLTALTLKLESWMLEPDFLQYIPVYNIEATKEALKRGETPLVWLESHDETVFTIADGRDMEIISGLRLWFDDGEKEVRITEKNYKDFDSSRFYKERTGRYDRSINV